MDNQEDNKTANQDWNETVTRQIDERVALLKKAQIAYYNAREEGLSHSLALAIAIEKVINLMNKR